MDIDYNLGFNDVNDFEHWTGHHSGCNVEVMKTLADRLNQRMAEIGMTQDRLGELAGVSQTTIFKLCSGKAKETRKLLAISDALGVSPKWLQSGKGPMTGTVETRSFFVNANPPTQIGAPIVEWDDPSDLPDGQYVVVPRYDVHAAAGNGHVVYEEVEIKGQSFRADWVKKRGFHKRNLRCIYARGNSMNPVICDGFSIVINVAETTIQDGKIYVIRYGDEIRVKYLHKRFDGGLIIRSENSDEFPEVEVKADDMKHIEVLGRVVHVAGDF